MSCNKKINSLKIVMINFKFNGNSLKVNHRIGKTK